MTTRPLLASLVAVGALAACAGPAYDPVTMDPDPIDRKHRASMSEMVVESGGARMNAILYLPQGPGPHPAAVLLHGFPGNERNLDLAQAMRRAGWAVLFFHYRGAWGSEGDFSFTHALEDVGAAVALLRSEGFTDAHDISSTRVALVGHSMGGFIALHSGSRLPDVACVASMAGANLGLMGQLAGNDPAAADATARRLEGWRGPVRGTSGERLVAEVAAHAEEFDTRRDAPALASRTLLLVAGGRDVVTPPDVHHAPLVAALADAGAPRVRAVTLDTDHAFSDRRIALAHLLVDWLDGECRASL
jgi:dipeptidyl aminopeptidase/acylaminoacyl peptidase